MAGPWSYDLELLAQTNIVVADAAHVHTADEASVYVGLLTMADALHTHAADAPTLQVRQGLKADDALHDHAADTDIVLGGDLVNGPWSYDLVLLSTTDTNLVVADALHAHTAEAMTTDAWITIAETSETTYDDTDSTLTYGETYQYRITLADGSVYYSNEEFFNGMGTLEAADALHAHTADTPAMRQGDLGVNDALHAHTADQPKLQLKLTLSAADALHAHTSDEVPLEYLAVLPTNDALHAHTADEVFLAQVITLTAADCVHTHTSEGVSIELGNLRVEDALHAHYADGDIFLGTSDLQFADATHAHTADSLTLSGWARRGKDSATWTQRGKSTSAWTRRT